MSPSACAVKAIFCAIALVGMGNCGKPSAPAASEPTAAATAEVAGDATSDADGDALIDPDKLEAVNTLLARKRFSTSRCIQAAQDAGEIIPSESVKVVLSFFVGAAGKAHTSKVTEGAGRSKTLESCLIEFVEGLTFEPLPRDVEFSQTYYFSGV